MNNKCVNILFGFIIIVMIIIIIYVCFKNKIECFSNVEMKNNLNNLDYLFDFKDFKKNMTEKCNNIANKQFELNKIIENDCKETNINNDIKCRTLQETNIFLDKNKNNYCLFAEKQIEGFSNDFNYYNYN